MAWLIIVVVLVIVVWLVAHIFVRRLLMDIRAGKLRQRNVFSKKDWQPILWFPPQTPVRMAFTEILTKDAYLGNFKTSFDRFIDVGLIADDKLNAKPVLLLSENLHTSLSNMADLSQALSMLESLDTRESCMVASGILYALICTQDKGSNIKRRLMEGNSNHAGNDVYLQQKSDREYFEYINDKYPNFCQLVSILEPRKANMIEIVAGYLLTE